MFLKEFKHIRKEVIKDIIGDPEISSDEYDKSDKEQINCLGYFLKTASLKKRNLFLTLQHSNIFGSVGLF